MKFNILFLKTSKGFTGKEKQKIKSILKNTTNRAAKILKLKNRTINFVIYPFNGKFTWGTAESNDWIKLYICRKKFNENDLKSAVYHEMHHIARNFTFLTRRKISFLETLFSEGLAVAFEIGQVPKRIPQYAKYTEALIKKWLPKIKKEKLFGEDFSHDEWFLGKKGKPNRLGYKIGTYLADQIKKNHPELTPGKIVRKNVKTLLKLSKVIL